MLYHRLVAALILLLLTQAASAQTDAPATPDAQPVPVPVITCSDDNWFAQTSPCTRMCVGQRITHVLVYVSVINPFTGEPKWVKRSVTCAQFLGRTREA